MSPLDGNSVFFGDSHYFRGCGLHAQQWSLIISSYKVNSNGKEEGNIDGKIKAALDIQVLTQFPLCCQCHMEHTAKQNCQIMRHVEPDSRQVLKDGDFLTHSICFCLL